MRPGLILTILVAALLAGLAGAWFVVFEPEPSAGGERARSEPAGADRISGHRHPAAPDVRDIDPDGAAMGGAAEAGPRPDVGPRDTGGKGPDAGAKEAASKVSESEDEASVAKAKAAEAQAARRQARADAERAKAEASRVAAETRQRELAEEDARGELRSTGWTQDRLRQRLRAKGLELPETILTSVSGKVMVHGLNKGLPNGRVVLHSFVPERNLRGAPLVPFATEFTCDDKGQFTGNVPLGLAKPDDHPALVISVYVGDTIPTPEPGTAAAQSPVPITPGMLAMCAVPVVTGAPGEVTSLGIFWAPEHVVNLAVEGTSVPEALGVPLRFTGEIDPARWHHAVASEALSGFPLLRPTGEWRMESGEIRPLYLMPANPNRVQFAGVMSGSTLLRAHTGRINPKPEEAPETLWTPSPRNGARYIHRCKFVAATSLTLSGRVVDAAGVGIDGAILTARHGRSSVSAVSTVGGAFTLSAIPGGGSVIEVSHESYTNEIAFFALLRREKAPVIRMSSPRALFTLATRDVDSGLPVGQVTLKSTWQRKAPDRGNKVKLESFESSTHPASADGKYLVTGEHRLLSLLVTAQGYRPFVIDLGVAMAVPGNLIDVMLRPVRSFSVLPSQFSFAEERAGGAAWTVPNDGSGHVFTYWGDLAIEYTVDFSDAGRPGALSQPVPFELVLGARNQGVVDNSYAFRIDVLIDGTLAATRTILADTLNERTATFPLGKLTGTKKVRIVWRNDRWIPNELDANIRLSSLRFVETVE